MDEQASKSSVVKQGMGSEERTNGDEPRVEEPPSVQFTCCVCGMSEKCRYGTINVTGRTYKEEVYYMMDPFRNRAKVDGRRVSAAPRDTSRGGRARGDVNDSSKMPNILDFFVIGALCAICGQSACVDELCSVFYSKTFCSTCVMREHEHFPAEIVQQIELARAARQRREAERSEEVKAPIVEQDE